MLRLSVFLLAISTVAFGEFNDISGQANGIDKMSGGGGGDHMGYKLCMAQCSYLCMANGGKIDTCAALFDFNSLRNLPEMDSCPVDTSVINGCFQRCGCQCTRCTVCMMKNMNPISAKVICWANPNPVKCLMEKKNEALLNCN